MTTVGYGDIYPKSDLGRITGIIICIWGVFIVSVFVVTLTNLLDFEKNEDKTYQLLYKLKYKEKLRSKSVFVMTSAAN